MQRHRPRAHAQTPGVLPERSNCRALHGRFERATLTPCGAAAIQLQWSGGSLEARAWGPGGQWLLDRLPSLVGLDDDPGGFEPASSSTVGKLWKQFPGLRITASHTMWHDTAWLVPGQRVATVDAARQWGALVRRYGTPAPGPLDLLLPPTPEAVLAAPYYDLHEVGLERKRAGSLHAAAKYIPRFETDTHLEPEALRHKLELIPGLGPWMSTNIVTMTAGHADTVVLGDYGLPSFVTWALAGERVGTDERMLELLEPYAGHRWRVCRLIMSSKLRPPRHGPRVRNPRIEHL